MNSEGRFSETDSKIEITRAIKQRWIQLSAIILALIGGGLTLNQSKASAKVTSRPAVHTYRLIDSDAALNHYSSALKVTPQHSYQNIKDHVNNLGNHIVQRSLRQETIPSQSQNIPKESPANNNINSLRPYQTGKYNGFYISRVTVPFNKIRIHRPVLLSNSIISHESNLPRLSHGTFYIREAFNKYDRQHVYLYYLINVNHHNYYITSNPRFVYFVLPSTNYLYYQSQINKILTNQPNNYKLHQISESLDSLNAQHIVNYKVYLSLYLDAYNLQQNEHPIYLNNAVNKKHVTIVHANNAVTRVNPDSLTSGILNKINSINSSCQEATNYDNQAIKELNSMTIPVTTKINNLKSVILNEINTNNHLVNELRGNANEALNNINGYNSFKFEMTNLTLELEMANNIDVNARQILNTDVRDLDSIY